MDDYLYGSDVVDYPTDYAYYGDQSPGGGYYGSDISDYFSALSTYGDESPGGGYYGSDVVTGPTITDKTYAGANPLEILLGGNLGLAAQKALGGLGDLSSTAIKKLLLDEKGGLDMQKLATIGGGLAGLLGVGNRPAEKVGYQGQIPALTAVRERVPQTDAQRPGAAGRRYFSDIQYVAPGQAAAAQQAAAQQAAGLAQLNAQPVPGYAEGGIAGGYYLGGKTDGMSDEIPANIDGKQPAKLSDGEFVVPADVVSHLGNGNSEAGAERLYEMMDRIRKARTGTTKQGRQIKPEKLLPA